MFSEFFAFEVPFPISTHAFLHEFFEQSYYDSQFSELLSLLLPLVFKCKRYCKFSKSGTMFFLGRDAPVLLFILFYFFYFVFCTLFLIFTLCDFCVSERFSLLSRHGLILLEHFLFHFSVVIFLDDYLF